MLNVSPRFGDDDVVGGEHVVTMSTSKNQCQVKGQSLADESSLDIKSQCVSMILL